MDYQDKWDLIDLLHASQTLSFTYDLQWFAAEDEGRTEEPTEYKKKKARDEGDVAKSQELTGIIVFMLAFWTMSLLANQTYKGLQDIMTFFITGLLDIQLDGNNLTQLYLQVIWLIARIVLPIMGVAVVAALGANILQTGFLFTPKKLNPDISKIFKNIPKNLSRMFWSGETMFNLLKSLMKITGVFTIAGIIISNRIHEVLTIPHLTAGQSLGIIANIIFQFVSIAGVMLMIFAAGDYAFQRWQKKQSLRMSKHEIKEEYKEMEGNPQIKAKIREMQRRFLSQNKMLQEVPNADVVITNPTHFAVAIKYDPNYMPAPMVVAKGENAFAQQIKKVAGKNNVYIIENKPLARELYRIVEVGDEIPAELFKAVARILSMVYQMKSPIEAA